jgi:hypothetical protein
VVFAKTWTKWCRVLRRVCHGAIEPIEAAYMATRRKYSRCSRFGSRDLRIAADLISRMAELAVARCKEIRVKADARRRQESRAVHRPHTQEHAASRCPA